MLLLAGLAVVEGSDVMAKTWSNLNIRIDAELRKAVDVAARAQGLSVTAYVVQVLERTTRRAK